MNGIFSYVGSNLGAFGGGGAANYSISFSNLIKIHKFKVNVYIIQEIQQVQVDFQSDYDVLGEGPNTYQLNLKEGLGAE